MKHWITSGAVLIVCVLFTSCKNGHSPFRRSPGDVVKAYYRACNDGKYSDVKGYFSEDGKKLLDSDMVQLVGGIKGVCDKETKNGTIMKVDITSEKIRGEGAAVIDTIIYKDGSKDSDDKNSLILENGSWKLTGGD